MAVHILTTELGNRDFFIRRWQQEHPAFVEVFMALPPDRLDYRPHPASRSAGELVALLVSAERSCVELCETGRSSYNSGLRFHPTDGLTNLNEMIAKYEQSYRRYMESARLADTRRTGNHSQRHRRRIAVDRLI